VGTETKLGEFYSYNLDYREDKCYIAVVFNVGEKLPHTHLAGS